MSTEIGIVVRQDARAKKWLIVSRRRDGIYLAVFDRRFGGMHVSYHDDGRVNFRAEKVPGPDPPPMSMVPLRSIETYVVYPYLSMPLSDEQLERLPDVTAGDAFDFHIAVERSEFRGRISCRLYLLRPGYAERVPLPFPAEKLLVERVIRETNPWILVQVLAPGE